MFRWNLKDIRIIIQDIIKIFLLPFEEIANLIPLIIKVKCIITKHDHICSHSEGCPTEQVDRCRNNNVSCRCNNRCNLFIRLFGVTHTKQNNRKFLMCFHHFCHLAKISGCKILRICYKYDLVLNTVYIRCLVI